MAAVVRKVMGKAGWGGAATGAGAAEVVILASEAAYWPVKAAEAAEGAAKVAGLGVLRGPA
jgi:hypothetical protein